VEENGYCFGMAQPWTTKGWGAVRVTRGVMKNWVGQPVFIKTSHPDNWWLVIHTNVNFIKCDKYLFIYLA
jgi:hypothetical protein